MDLDEEILSDFSDSEIVESHHKSLVDTISTLDKKSRLKPAIRKEPSLQISEYHLVNKSKEKKNLVNVNSLVKSLKNKPNNVHIAKKITAVQKSNRNLKLPKPLEKIHADKIEREVAFENVKEDLTKWDPIVYDNRIADQLTFPLKKADVDFVEEEQKKEKSHHEFLNYFQQPNELELALAKILDSSKVVTQYREAKERREQEIRERKEKSKNGEFQLTLKEMIEKQKEFSKIRAQKAYKEKKAWMQNKIKSKKYHRILKRERVKEKIKEFEKLQKTDPEAALQQLELLDKTRAQERISLRHRSTGKWAKNLSVRAKYDKDSRIALAEQLSQSRALTQKVKRDSSSDEEDDSGVEQDGEDETNPWMKQVDANDVDSYFSGYRKYWQDKDDAEDSSVTPNDGQVSEEKMKGPLKSIDNDKVDIAYKINDRANEKIDNIKTMQPDDNRQKINQIKKNNKQGKNNEKTEENPKSEIVESNHKDNGELPIQETNSRQNIGKKKSINEIETQTKDKDNNKQSKKKRKLERNILNESGLWVVSSVEDGSKQCDDNGNEEATEGNERGESNEKSRKRRKKRKSKGQNSENSSPTNNMKTGDKEEPKYKIDFSTDRNIENVFNNLESQMKNKVKEKVKKIVKSIDETNKRNKDKDSGQKSNKRNERKYDFNDRKKIRKTIDLDEALEEVHKGEEEKSFSFDELKKMSQIGNKEISPNEEKSKDGTELEQIDPNEFLKIDKTVKQLTKKMPKVIHDDALDDEDSDDDEVDDDSQQMTIEEAFAEDDVVQEFRQEKENEKKKANGIDIDLTLPGWGSWGGVGISKKVMKKKRRRFVIKNSKLSRKDEKKPIVIINEEKTEDLKKHLVDEIPYPFSSVKEYEASLRAPLGREWVPEIAHRKLIEPAIKTKIGTIIEPINYESEARSKMKMFN